MCRSFLRACIGSAHVRDRQFHEVMLMLLTAPGSMRVRVREKRVASVGSECAPLPRRVRRCVLPSRRGPNVLGGGVQLDVWLALGVVGWSLRVVADGAVARYRGCHAEGEGRGEGAVASGVLPGLCRGAEWVAGEGGSVVCRRWHFAALGARCVCVCAGGDCTGVLCGGGCCVASAGVIRQRGVRKVLGLGGARRGGPEGW